MGGGGVCSGSAEAQRKGEVFPLQILEWARPRPGLRPREGGSGKPPGRVGEESGGGRLAAGLFVLWEGCRVGQSPETGEAWPLGWQEWAGPRGGGRGSDWKGLQRTWV